MSCSKTLSAALPLAVLATLLALPAHAKGEAACVMGAMRGIPESDAETVAEIVCEALRDRGVDVGHPTLEPGAGEAYRIDARPLGSKLFLTVTRENASGASLGKATLDVVSIEEVPVAAPRLAGMVVDGKSASQTATVSTLVGDETRQYQKKGGETLWGLGFTGIAVPDSKVFPGFGLVFRGAFETEDFGIVGDLRLTGASPSGRDDAVVLFTASINGRYFLLSGGWSPFIGAGLGWTAAELTGEEFSVNETGMGANVEAGLEFLRFYKSRLSVDFRVDLPFFDLSDFSGSNKRYVTPLTFGLTYMWW
ncbi:MAG TPA: hypothetical protein VGD74_13210 [Vulgatibacter sp.]